MTDVNLRALALDILISVNEEGRYSHLLLREVLEKYQYLPKQERAFLTRLVEGTLERQITLDYVLDSFSKTKVQSMKPLIRNLLRLGAYQILYMDSVPDSAAVSEAVKLAKKRGFSGLSGFVNGVLRSVARNGTRVSFPDRESDPAGALSVSGSIPLWIIELWEKSYGMQKTEEIVSGFSGEQGFSIRVNLHKTSPEKLREELEAKGLTLQPVEAVPYAFYLRGLDHLGALTNFQNGEFYVQDVSSMRVAELAGVRAGDYVIDVCAAPGGKSLHLAELLCGSGMVEARDLTEYKVGLIRENIKRHGFGNIRAVMMDAAVRDPASVEKADVLICDLPCSGLGVLAKKPDIRYRMTLQKTKELVLLQRKIIGTVQEYVKRGGTLVYSTCTINPAENEENVEWFLQEYPDYTCSFKEQMFPSAANHDGFFLAKFSRNE